MKYISQAKYQKSKYLVIMIKQDTDRWIAHIDEGSRDKKMDANQITRSIIGKILTKKSIGTEGYHCGSVALMCSSWEVLFREVLCFSNSVLF